jgi:COP9 signalosome complex subunit 2
MGVRKDSQRYDFKGLLCLINILVYYKVFISSVVNVLYFFIFMLDNRKTIMDDPFIKMYIDDVLRNIRTQVLLQAIRPYRTITLDYLSRQLGVGITKEEVESLLVLLILDEKIKGRLDQLNQVLEVDNGQDQRQGYAGKSSMYAAQEQWSDALVQVAQSCLAKLS